MDSKYKTVFVYICCSYVLRVYYFGYDISFFPCNFFFCFLFRSIRALDGFSNSNKVKRVCVCVHPACIHTFELNTGEFEVFVCIVKGRYIHIQRVWCLVYRQQKIINTSPLMKKREKESEREGEGGRESENEWFWILYVFGPFLILN